jgi:hypothetical protein
MDSPCQRRDWQIIALQGIHIFVLHGPGEVGAIPYLCVVDDIPLESDFIDLGEVCCMAKQWECSDCGQPASDIIDMEGGGSNAGGAG